MLICPCCSELFNHRSPSPYLRVMQNKQDTWDGFTATYGCKRLLSFEGYEDICTQSLEKTAAHDHPEFKDLTKTR